MIRVLQIVSVVAATATAIFVFQVKYRAEAVAERASELQRKIDRETESVSLLRAEWSLLNQPTRVQELVRRHQDALKLEPLDPKQIVRFEQLPLRPAGPMPADEAALSAILGSTPDRDAADLEAMVRSRP